MIECLKTEKAGLGKGLHESAKKATKVAFRVKTAILNISSRLYSVYSFWHRQGIV